MIDPLWSLETDGASYLANRLRIKTLLHKNQPPSCKGDYVSLHAYVQNICLGVFTTSDPSGPVNHNLLIGYLKLASGLDGDQNGNNHCMEATYCHGQVASIIQQSHKVKVPFISNVELNHPRVNIGQWHNRLGISARAKSDTLIKFKGNIGIRQKHLNDIEGRNIPWNISA